MEKTCCDTLLLVIRENDGLVSEYQRQLYEAASLGIGKVMYCLITDSNSKNNNSRLSDILQKLRMTSELFNLKSFDRGFTCYSSSSLRSRIVKTDDHGTLVDIGDDFTKYKDDNASLLQRGKRTGEVLIKKMQAKINIIGCTGKE